MADVKIIDIDSEQWNIKDETARNSVSELRTEIKYKIVVKNEYYSQSIKLSSRGSLQKYYYASITPKIKPSENAILFQVTQRFTYYPELIISPGNENTKINIASSSSETISGGLYLTLFWLVPIAE